MVTAPRSDFDWLLQQIAIALNSWRLVIIGTAIMTAMGATIMLWLSPTVYSSQIILPLTPSLQAMIRAGVVGRSGATVIQLPPNSPLYSVSVSAPSPDEAEAAARTMLDQIIERSKPSGTDRSILLNQIEFLKSSVAEAKQIRQAVILSLAAEMQLKLIETEAKLAGLTPGDVILPPTKAARSDRPLLLRLAIIFLTSAALMLFVAWLRLSFRSRIGSRLASL